jgi:2-alkyl-3-oxoalkanoate reductase
MMAPTTRRAAASSGARGDAEEVAPTAIAARALAGTLPVLARLLSTATVAVTGANGYFGHRMVQSLLAAGVPRVAAVDRVHTRPWPAERVRVETADVRDADAMARALAGAEVVVHVASFFGAPPFGTLADTGEWSVNAEGTACVLRAAAAPGATVRMLVYISSSSAIVSGREELVGATEDHAYPARYLDYYGPSKAAAERAVLAAHSPTLATCVLRPSGIYGEDELLHVPRVLSIVDRLGGWLPFYFAGAPVSDWTHAENLAWGVYLALDQLRLPGGGRAGAQIFHVTDGEALSTHSRTRHGLGRVEVADHCGPSAGGGGIGGAHSVH